MMEKHKLNYAASQELYDANSDRYHMKECYTNIWNALILHMEKFQTGEWKIVYGYMTSVQNMLVRHCFIIGQDGLVIDLTLFTTHIPDREETEYYIMYVFQNVDEYFDAIEAEGGYPALDRYLNKFTKQAVQWGLDNELVLVG